MQNVLNQEMITHDHDKVIAKLQYFAEMLRQRHIEKQSLLIVLGKQENCEKEKIKEQINTIHQTLEDYYDLFDEILYR